RGAKPRQESNLRPSDYRSNPRLHHRRNSYFYSPGYQRRGTGIAACRRPKSHGPKYPRSIATGELFHSLLTTKSSSSESLMNPTPENPSFFLAGSVGMISAIFSIWSRVGSVRFI